MSSLGRLKLEVQCLKDSPIAEEGEENHLYFLIYYCFYLNKIILLFFLNEKEPAS